MLVASARRDVGAEVKLTILGGGGWLPAHGRHTASAILRHGEAALLIDAGTGVCRLLEAPHLLNGLQRLDILLTHFHLDHIAGLAYLPALGGCEQTTIWGPGKLLYERSTASLLDHVSREPFHPVPLESQDVAVAEIPPGELELGEFKVQARRQGRHSAPTLGLRFGDSLTWITDTAYETDSARFAAGSRLVAHEAWFAESSPRNPEIHSSAREAAQIAELSGSSALMLIHLPPFEAGLEPLLQEAAVTFPAVRCAEDGLELDLA